MRKYDPNCFGCSIQNGSYKFPGGFLYSSKHFNVVQDPVVPIPGFLVVNAKRHITSIAQFTKSEIKEFTRVVFVTRKAMLEVLDIKTVCLVQEEKACHFHIWLLPEYPWMKKFQPGIMSSRKIMKYAIEHMTSKQDKNNLAKATRKMKRYFINL